MTDYELKWKQEVLALRVSEFSPPCISKTTDHVKYPFKSPNGHDYCVYYEKNNHSTLYCKDVLFYPVFTQKGTLSGYKKICKIARQIFLEGFQLNKIYMKEVSIM